MIARATMTEFSLWELPPEGLAPREERSLQKVPENHGYMILPALPYSEWRGENPEKTNNSFLKCLLLTSLWTSKDITPTNKQLKKLPFSKFVHTYQIPHFGLYKSSLPESYFLIETIERKTWTWIIFVLYFPANNDTNNLKQIRQTVV